MFSETVCYFGVFTGMISVRYLRAEDWRSSDSRPPTWAPVCLVTPALGGTRSLGGPGPVKRPQGKTRHIREAATPHRGTDLRPSGWSS